MGMVGRAAINGVDLIILSIEHLAIIPIYLGLREVVVCLLGIDVVNVTQKGDSRTGLLAYVGDLPSSDTADPDARDLNSLTGWDASCSAENVTRDDGHTRQEGAGSPDKLAPRQSWILFSGVSGLTLHNGSPLTDALRLKPH
jgi:hypothetical protein